MQKDLVNFERYYFEDTRFQLLMSKRISEILLICNDYDAFMLEEDGRIEERVFNEYASLHLRYPPHFHRASSYKKALKLMDSKDFDLVITLHNSGFWDAHKLNTKLKKKYPDKPFVVLAPFSRNVMRSYDLSSVNSDSDYIFSWLGDTNILVAIIKLIEDSLNVENDVKLVGVQTIILVENSIRYYSTYLPKLYETLFSQTLHVMSEGLNDHQKNLRMRGRPKILLATDYEQAIKLYRKFKNNLLGVITDVEYNKNGKHNKEAGHLLCREIRKYDTSLPIVVQSNNQYHDKKAENYNAGFINKQSSTLLSEIGNYISENFGFGEFNFIDPRSNEVIMSVSNLREMQKAIGKVKGSSLEYHARRNDFSKWLRARTLFPIARIFKPRKIEDFTTINEIRSYMVNVIKNYRKNSNIGVIAKFSKDSFDEVSGLARIGVGSIGGKARGLAFMDYVLKEKRKNYAYESVLISIPQTIVLATDVFSEFMKMNDLYQLAYSEADDQVILDNFLKAELPGHVLSQLQKLITDNKFPLAVRSSSLLEDSYYQPFAGIYATYMIPNNSRNEEKRFDDLVNAVKCVYASTYYKAAKKYLKATKNVIEEERMAVIVQKISGRRHGQSFYPTFSGVARSINNYPIGHERHDICVANIAAGLGKTIVDSEISLRFSPETPENVMQLSSAEYALKFTQKHFYGLDMKSLKFKSVIDESNNLRHMDIYDGFKDGAFDDILSSYDHNSNIIRDTADFPGSKIVSFANILKRETFPLSNILKDILKTLEKSMSNPVEIEFAVNLDEWNELHSFDLLQARPIVSGFESSDIDISKVTENESLLRSFSSLGNGVIDNLYDIIYVKPDCFDPAKTRKIATTVKELNKKFITENKNYILIGPGRWGTSDTWLGIPVRWEDVCQASVIVEAGQENFFVQQSQGSHFFHNITTFGIFYFTINPFLKDGTYDLDYLSSFKPVYEDKFVRHIRFNSPVIVKTDGRTGNGVIFKS